MEQTFMTIHNLSPNANILFASASIIDILGYQPRDVQGRSCFDYFHPQEVPFARYVHSRGVLLDKAAVLHYARIRASDGRWVSCECCFTVVHDVLVACTSVYRRGLKSERRALEAPHIRRIFSSSPRDPRYHMLEHLSPKFRMPPVEREPRAALVLNRFTRSLTILFATDAVSSILGVPPEQIVHKSFWECIAENCLPDAVQCLESAKQNDSIAYLRFWYRDPRRDEDFEQQDGGGNGNDEPSEPSPEGNATSSTCSDSDGGVRLDEQMEIDSEPDGIPPIKSEGDDGDVLHATPFRPTLEPSSSTGSSSSVTLGRGLRQSGRRANNIGADTSRRRGMLSQNAPRSRGVRGGRRRRQQPQRSPPPPPPPVVRRRPIIPTFELEAVVSCTSDGLVVVLRRARPPIPELQQPPVSSMPTHFENGLFAAPWSDRAPIEPSYPASSSSATQIYQSESQTPRITPHIQSALSVNASQHGRVSQPGGPPLDQLMRSIRDVAVFAWALAGINGNIASYGRGLPGAGAQPQDGLPIWDPSVADSDMAHPSHPSDARVWPGQKAPSPSVDETERYNFAAHANNSEKLNPGVPHSQEYQQRTWSPDGEGLMQSMSAVTRQPTPPPQEFPSGLDSSTNGMSSITGSGQVGTWPGNSDAAYQMPKSPNHEDPGAYPPW